MILPMGFGMNTKLKKLREDGYTFDPEDEPVLYKLNETLPPYGLNDGMGLPWMTIAFYCLFMYSGMGLSRWKA